MGGYFGDQDDMSMISGALILEESMTCTVNARFYAGLLTLPPMLESHSVTLEAKDHVRLPASPKLCDGNVGTPGGS
jgi:hypothetical protein